jgi:DNA-binding response OmpR family regulator
MNRSFPQGQKHVFVVDDNEEMLSILDFILKKNSYQVTAKNRVDDFIGVVKQIKPDLILLDTSLGWADGCELCISIKLNDGLRMIPVIMISAYYTKREGCILAGADDFLQKPFDISYLLSRVAAFTSGRDA